MYRLELLGILNEISNTGYTETVMFKFWNCWTKDDNISSYGFDPQICHSNVLHKSTMARPIHKNKLNIPWITFDELGRLTGNYSLWTANYIANEW